MMIYDVRAVQAHDKMIGRMFNAFDKATSANPAVRKRRATKRVGCGGTVGHRASSAKAFDTEKPIPASDLADMREAGVLAPSKSRRKKASAKSRQPRPNTEVSRRAGTEKSQ